MSAVFWGNRVFLRETVERATVCFAKRVCTRSQINLTSSSSIGASAGDASKPDQYKIFIRSRHVVVEIASPTVLLFAAPSDLYRRLVDRLHYAHPRCDICYTHDAENTIRRGGGTVASMTRRVRPLTKRTQHPQAAARVRLRVCRNEI